MMFICNADGCPNMGVEYDFGDDAPAFAECGGCGARLLVNE
jgi:hypothetical protein